MCNDYTLLLLSSSCQVSGLQLVLGALAGAPRRRSARGLVVPDTGGESFTIPPGTRRQSGLSRRLSWQLSEGSQSRAEQSRAFTSLTTCGITVFFVCLLFLVCLICFGLFYFHKLSISNIIHLHVWYSLQSMYVYFTSVPS